MTIRFVLCVLVICTACQSGFIPCPESKGVRLKRSHAKQVRTAERNTITASSRDVPNTNSTNVKYRQTRPALEHVDVEEWDCPKPGSKSMPKAVKENIKKNTRKMKSHYKNRNDVDSLNITPPPSY